MCSFPDHGRVIAMERPDDVRVPMNPRGTTAIDFYVPSLDGRFVAVSPSENGSEDGSAHIYETATGRELPDIIPRVNYPTAAGSIEWNKDASGFYYTRHPRGDERKKEELNFYQQVYFHKLGTPTTADTYVIGKEELFSGRGGAFTAQLRCRVEVRICFIKVRLTINSTGARIAWLSCARLADDDVVVCAPG